MYGIYRYLNARNFDIHEGIIGIARKFFTGESEMGFIDCKLFTVLNICERIIAIFSFRFLRMKIKKQKLIFLNVR